MAENSQIINYGEEIIGWQIPEYEKHKRTKLWYVMIIIIALALLLFAFFTKNFLFAVIIIMAGFVIILHDGREPELVKITVTDEGIIVGRKFYDYDEIKDFSIVYKPSQGIKNLYFEFKSAVRHRLSIPLLGMNPLQIREYLLKYLPEDLERTDQPLSEGLARLFKL